jgi:polyhydroxyalkanoate synthase
MPGASAQTKAPKSGPAEPGSAARATAPHRMASPRPLPYHLAAATAVWTSSLAALPNLRSGSILFPPDLGSSNLAKRVEVLRADLAAVPTDAFAEALTRELRGRADRFLVGLETYRTHPYRRDLVDPPTVWEDGASRLLDFGAGADAGVGRSILVVPSLVNRHYVLDLDADSSLMRYLAARGLRPYLIDWGTPGPAEAGFALDDYIVRRLGGALDAVLARSGEAPVLLGYCMGGNLALALAALRPDAFAGLALLATPWDFHVEAASQAQALATAFEPVWPCFEDLGTVPVDLLQSLFAALDPQLVLRKFMAFSALDPASPEAARFVALEDWLNDGVALPTPVARDCILGWYGENRPARGDWTVAGLVIDPNALRLPAMVVVPAQDRIVPPASALALAEALPKAVLRRPALGHIGMIVGRRARRSVWGPLARWIEGF